MSGTWESPWLINAHTQRLYYYVLAPSLGPQPPPQPVPMAVSVFSGDPVLKDYKPMNFVKPYVKETCFRTVKEEFNSLNNKLVRKEFHFTYSMTHNLILHQFACCLFVCFNFPNLGNNMRSTTLMDFYHGN